MTQLSQHRYRIEIKSSANSINILILWKNIDKAVRLVGLLVGFSRFNRFQLYSVIIVCLFLFVRDRDSINTFLQFEIHSFVHLSNLCQIRRARWRPAICYSFSLEYINIHFIKWKSASYSRNNKDVSAWRGIVTSGSKHVRLKFSWKCLESVWSGERLNTKLAWWLGMKNEI